MHEDGVLAQGVMAASTMVMQNPVLNMMIWKGWSRDISLNGLGVNQRLSQVGRNAIEQIFAKEC